MRRRALEIHVEGIDFPAMPAGGERRLREALERELAGAAGADNHQCAGPEAVARRMRAGVFRAIGEQAGHVD